MAQRSALIVDDSPTARQVLANVLKKHDVFVDMAGSAEDALEHLVSSRPDVIFMDHQMPGMDGLQAVQAIKANPATATIPIMMYTSQEGELYVGQARALGAVGVLPKQIKPVEVSALLESLHLIPPAPGATTPADEVEILDPGEPTDSLPPYENAPGDWPEMHRWLEQVLDQHGQELRFDIERTMQRLLDERTLKPSQMRRRRTDNMKWWQLPANWALLALSGLAGVFLWLYLDTQQNWRTLSEQNASLLAALDAQRAASDQETADWRERLDTERAVLGGRNEEFLAALEWTANQSGPYDATAIPLSDERLQMVDGLVQRLLAVGFTGVIQVDSHVGDFCYMGTSGEGLQPAPAAAAADSCDQIGLKPEAALAASARQSRAFANYVAALEGQTLTPIRVQVEAYGNRRPRFFYPGATQGTTAGEWNAIARRNNRVEIRLLPDD